MKLKIAVVGARKAGKTLFCINFAEYLGASSLCYSEKSGYSRGGGVISPLAARKLMVEHGHLCNGAVRTFSINLPGLQPPGRVALMDTAPFKEESSLSSGERKKLILTLQAIQDADAVFHLVDLPCSDPARLEFALALNRRLAEFCKSRGKPFLLLGAKQDLLNGCPSGFHRLFAEGGRVVRISSITRSGFLRLRRLLFEERAEFSFLQNFPG